MSVSSAGARPVREARTQRWDVRPETGVVLVLLPGATVAVGSRPIRLPPGAQPTSWPELYALASGSEGHGKPWFDPGHERADETLVEGVALDAVFVSKYELTQAQCERVLGRNPSQHRDPATLGGPTHPVETISWHDAVTVVTRLGLALPTEAQWEHACRAGTTTPFSSGADFESLQDHADIADQTFLEGGNTNGGTETPEVRDGFICHAPVGSFSANDFGLHDLHGNVWEWCLDVYSQEAPRAGDGLRAGDPASLEGTIRGGSWSTGARVCRSANRMNFDRNNTDGDLGLRPVRRVDP